jgi:hypothetical protein
MKHRKLLSETLQKLLSNGYSLADTSIDALPDESIQSNDWRIDAVEKIRQEQGSAIVIAVSSVRRCKKLVFVEVSAPKAEFSPMTLLRRLFPANPRAHLQMNFANV